MSSAGRSMVTVTPYMDGFTALCYAQDVVDGVNVHHLYVVSRGLKLEGVF